MKAEKYYNHGKYLENLCSGLKPPYNEILAEAFFYRWDKTNNNEAIGKMIPQTTRKYVQLGVREP